MKRMQALSTLCLAAALMAVLQGCASTSQADAQSVAMAEDVERVPVPFVQPEEIDLSQDAKAASVQRKGYRFKTPIEATVTVERRADGWLLMRVSQQRVKGLPPALAERRDMQNAQRMALRAAALYVGLGPNLVANVMGFHTISVEMDGNTMRTLWSLESIEPLTSPSATP